MASNWKGKTVHSIAISLLVCILLLGSSSTAVAYGRTGHKQITMYSLGYLQEIDLSAHNLLSTYSGKDPEIRGMKIRGKERGESSESWSFIDKLSEEAADVDDYYDLELVDVEGGFGNGGRDNPHEKELWAIDDKAHYSEKLTGNIFTALNHFIDIQKGPGEFDDYDGYAYKRGSGKKTDNKLDSMITFWYNDEYVHAPGQQWYENCSPSVERYSFPADKGVYANTVEEAKARFPLADSTGSDGKGVPFSVFMPLDNMARYWYGRFEFTKDLLCLGPVLHAVQDASIPHHAAGCLGNWHSRFESVTDTKVANWLADADFKAEVKDLVKEWSRNDPSPPQSLGVGDWVKVPAINWRTDHLVTWVALNAYREYDQTYKSFAGGDQYNADSQKQLTKLASAMSVLVLRKATGYNPPPDPAAKKATAGTER